MIQLCGYNFSGDINALDMMPTIVKNITSVRLEKGIYDHINVTKDTESFVDIKYPLWNRQNEYNPFWEEEGEMVWNYTPNIPQPFWDYNTILDCDFDENISGGNVKFTLENLTAIKIKRREKDSFDWITLKTIPINSGKDLEFFIEDYFAMNNTEYEYAIVPVTQSVEGEDYIIDSITSKFNGIFISDGEKIFKLFNGVVYESQESIYESNVYRPIGSKYPTVIDNGSADYLEGTISFNALGYNFEDTRVIDRISSKKQVQDFVHFMKNGKAKVLKDWNGNMYILALNGNISIAEDLVGGFRNISFPWVEQGDPTNQLDLYYNGLVNSLD